MTQVVIDNKALSLLLPAATGTVSQVVSTPSTPNNEMRLGKPFRSPTMEPETRKFPRSSPKLVQARKLSSPTSLSRRSGVKSSDFRGVSKCAKDGRWQSRIRVGKKVKYLGRFKTEEAAAAKYDEAALALHGRRATLNFELADEDLEYALANMDAKRAEFGFEESDINETYSARANMSRSSSRCTSPCQSYEDESDEATTLDDQNAALGLMWLRLMSESQL